MVFVVVFPVVVIDSHYQSIHILEQGKFILFLDGDRILNPIEKTLVIAVV